MPRSQSNSSSQPGSASGNTDRVVYAEWGSATESGSEASEVDRDPKDQKITIRRERKGRGGKTVTVITGFQHSSTTLNTLTKTLKAQCGSGGTAKDNTIEIQGDHRERLGSLLKGMGYTVKLAGG